MIQPSAFTRTFTDRELFLLRMLVLCLFLGRAWQGLFWDLPLRAFFWDQLMLEETVIWLTGDSWQNYVTNRSMNTDGMINTLGFSMGVFWALCALLTLLVKKTWNWARWIFYVAVFSLFLLALLCYKDKFLALGQLFEYSLQVSAPLLFVHVLYGGQNTFRFRLFVQSMIAICFFSHGLYAYGYYEQPAVWIQWCMDIFHFETNETARQFLVVMGVLDFVAAGLIFLPMTFFIIIWYCVLWGTLTALARIVGNFYISMPLESLHQHAYETLYRLVHGGIPFLMYYWNREK